MWAQDGFGLNANGAVLAVLDLSDSVAPSLAEGGSLWLNAQSGGRTEADWQPTSFPRDALRMGKLDSATGAWPDPKILACRDHHGARLAIPGDLRIALDAALNGPGSFYALGPEGLVAVVVPKTRLAHVSCAG